MTKKLLAIVCSLFLPLLAAAQPLSAYTNVQNEVMVWDNGAIRKIDYLQPIEMKIGRIAMPYIDNSRNFKIYYRGGVRNINIGFTNEFKVGDCLVSFLNATSLNVFDRGQITNLTRLCTNYYFGDSLIVFLDGRTQEYKSYYNGNVSTFEGFLADAQNTGVKSIEVGSNVAAYINYANQFHILYHGAVVEQEMYTVSSFKTGRNTVAYIDAGNQFKVFYDGTTQVLESFPPQSYSVGNGLVAYVTVDGNFNIFCNGKVYKMGYFRPVYQVSDFVVIYQDPSGYGKVFEDGQTTTLEPYMPEKFQAQYRSVAYFDRNNILKMYNNGEVNEVTSALTPGQDTWRLSYDVIMYQVGNNFFKFYYQGKEY